MLEIAKIPLGAGQVGISQMPGRDGNYRADLDEILAWHPALVVTLSTEIEMEAWDADRLPQDLAVAGIAWWHFPVNDFRAPCAAAREEWPLLSAAIHTALAAGQQVLVHCFGGCGRSGMTVLRLMIETGELPGEALTRLRAARPCAVETLAQEAWAAEGACFHRAAAE